MKRLERQIADWTSRNIISKIQGDAILDYERGKKSAGKPNRILYGFFIVGAAVIGIGIISLIAANWEQIPPSLKLAGDLLLLCITAFLVAKAHDRSGEYLFDAAAAFFSLLCLGSIALISQVFHTGGELYQALLLWALLILPLALMGKKNFLPRFWVIVSLSVPVSWAFSRASWYHDSALSAASVFVSIPFFSLAAGNMLGIAESPRRPNAGRFGRHYTAWGALTSLALMLATDITFSIKSSTLDFPPAATLYLLAGAANLTAWLSPHWPRKMKIVALVMSLLTVAAWLPSPGGLMLQGALQGVSMTLAEAAGALFSVLMLVMLGMVFIIGDFPRLFNAVMVLLAVRFIFVYFQVLGSLAMTGLGLIISGIMIMGIAFLWYRYRNRIGTFMAGILK